MARKTPTTTSKKATPDRSMASSVPAGDRKKALVKALRKAGAGSAGEAVPVTTLAEKLGWTRFDVYGLVNGTSGKAGSNPRCLVATGHVKTTFLEEGGLAVYLTATGKKTDFSDSPFVKGSAAE